MGISPKSHTSVVHIRDDWYILCRSKDLQARPRHFSLYGTPLVAFRGKDGIAGVLLDRCPHRNVPLSAGSVIDSRLQCSYHGWQFDASGTCQFAAGIGAGAITKACHATAFPVLERQGFLWVYGVPGIMPEREPGRFPLTDDAAYTTDVTELRADGTIYSVAENALDVPHTAYLHGGLFRSAGGRNRTLEVEVRTYGDRIEAEYFGEAAPTGLAGRVLAPGGGTVTHVDRFILPSITQVEYRLGSRTHILVTVAMTPEADHRTRLFAVVGYRAPLPGRLLKPILRPLFLKIFNQDAEMLRLQQQNLDRFGGEQFASIGADILGPGIMRLMKQRERGENGGEPHVEKRKIVI